MNINVLNIIRQSPEYHEVKKRLLNKSLDELGRYLAGIFETDGDAHFTLKSDQDKPEIRITQQDPAFLVALKDILENNCGGIKSRYLASSSTGNSNKSRAHRIVIDSWSSVKKFIEFLKQSFNPTLGLCCLGPKSKQLLVFECLSDRKTYGKSEKAKEITVDLKDNWHVISERARAPGTLSRANYETLKGLKANQSLNKAQTLITYINEKYKKQQELLEKFNNGTLTLVDKQSLPIIESSYLTGLLEGDGCFILNLYQRQDSRTNTFSLDVNTSVSIVGSQGDIPSHQSFLKSLDLKNSQVNVDPNNFNKVTTLIRATDDVEKVIKFVINNEVCREKNVKRFNALKTAFDIKQQRGSSWQQQDLVIIAEKAYGMPTSHGKKRRNSLTETIDFINSLFE